MLKDSMEHAKDDAFRRALAEAQVEAKRLVEAVQAALQSDGELVSVEERKRIDAAIVKLQETAAGENRRHITLGMDDLEAETKEFAARRMDKSIRRALAGRRVEELGNGLEAKGEQA
ncbi:MAG: molecular chaperone HscA, partial [Pseudomonadota bacterium]|nr:molecular chaperone HscA [Pseudomonadota bacterium]